LSEKLELIVYGAEVLCASCVNLPSSKEQYEWLQAAINRKYGETGIEYKYIDIFNPEGDDEEIEFAKRVVEEDLIYPVVFVEDEIVGEGNPRLKKVYEALEKRGLEPIS